MCELGAAACLSALFPQASVPPSPQGRGLGSRFLDVALPVGCMLVTGLAPSPAPSLAPQPFKNVRVHSSWKRLARVAEDRRELSPGPLPDFDPGHGRPWGSLVGSGEVDIGEAERARKGYWGKDCTGRPQMARAKRAGVLGRGREGSRGPGSASGMGHGLWSSGDVMGSRGRFS